MTKNKHRFLPSERRAAMKPKMFSAMMKVVVLLKCLALEKATTDINVIKRATAFRAHLTALMICR